MMMKKDDYEYIHCSSFSPKNKDAFICLICGCYSKDIYRRKGRHEHYSEYNWLCPKCFKKLVKKETFIFR